MAQTTANRRGPLGVVRSSFFLKTLAFAVILFVAGLASPVLFSESEFVGVFVGMVWSLAILIVVAMVVSVVGSAVRQELR